LKKKILGILLVLTLITALIIPMSVFAAEPTTTLTSSGSVAVSAIPITVVVINGASTAQDGVQLTAVVTPSAATVTYQWQECSAIGGNYTAISGATSNNYTPNATTPTSGDTGMYIEVVVIGTGEYSATPVTSLPTSVVLPYQYWYNISPTTVNFAKSNTVVQEGSSITITGTTTVYNWGVTSITGYTISGQSFVAPVNSTPFTLTGTPTAIGPTSSTVAGLTTGNSEIVTFTFTGTVGLAPSIPSTIQFSGLSFTLTPQ